MVFHWEGGVPVRFKCFPVPHKEGLQELVVKGSGYDLIKIMDWVPDRGSQSL